MIESISWVVMALISTACLAGMAEVNRYFKVEGFRLNFVRAAFAFLFLLPLYTQFYWPDERKFYLIILTAGLINVYAMTVFFDLAARYKTRISSMYLSVAALTAFGFWYLLHPDDFIALINNTYLGPITIVSFLGVMAALQFMRRNDYGFKTFMTILPIGVLFGVVDVFVKLFIENKYPVLGATLTFVTLSFWVTAIVSYLYLRHIKVPVSLDAPILKQGAILGALSCGAFLSGTLAIVNAPNPAYPGVIAMSVPVLLLIHHKIFGVKDDGSILASVFMVACIAALIYATI